MVLNRGDSYFSDERYRPDDSDAIIAERWGVSIVPSIGVTLASTVTLPHQRYCRGEQPMHAYLPLSALQIRPADGFAN